MVRFCLLCFILAEILLLQAVADKSVGTDTSQSGDMGGLADSPAHSFQDDATETEVAQAPEIRRLGKHHSCDKSVAGGGVIIGGLVTAIFAAVFTYIRVTRKRDIQQI